MNNIQKSFKNKAKLGLRMAVGGVINAKVDPQNQWGGGGGLVSMDHDPMADMNALDNLQTMSSQGNPFYAPGSRNDPHASSIQTTASHGAKPAAPYVEATRNKPLRNTMTPVDDMFSQSRLRLADGGVIADPVEALLARTKANYGVGAGQPTVEAPRPVAPPVTQPAPQAKSGGLLDNALRGLRGRAAQIDKAVGMAQGGVVKISGPGTGTSDDIPMDLRTNGKKINLNVSNGEALAVLPAKTAADPQAVDAVNEIIETTNGKPPKGLRAGGNYADGTVDEQVARAGFNRLYGDRSAAMALPVRQPVEAPIPEQSNTAPVEIAPPASLRKQMQTVPEGTTEKIVNLRHNALYGNRPYAEGRRAAPAPVETSYSDMTQPARAAQAATTSQVVPIKEQPAQAPQPAAVDPAQAAAAARADLQSRSDAYGKSVDLAQQVMRLPQGNDMMTRGNAGLRAVASNPAVRDVLNIAHEQQGDNIQYGLRRGADGKPQVMISGGAPTKSQYVGADGKPTSDWTKTRDYSDAIARNKADKARLAEIQRENMISDAQSGNPFYQQRGLRGIAAEKMLAEADGARGKNGVNGLDLAKYELDVAKFKHDLQKTDNLQGNADREFIQQKTERGGKTIDDELKAMAGEDKDGTRLAGFKAYINNHFKYDPKVHGEDPRNWAQQALNNVRLEQALSEIGARTMTIEKDFNGLDKTSWDYDPNPTLGDALRPGTWGRGGRFRNSKTGQVVSEGELSSLPEPLKNEFWSRVTNLPKDYVKRK